MSVNEKDLCIGCMSQLSPDGRCEACAYDAAQVEVNPNYLPPRSVIGNRYLVGKLNSCDPEGAWYVGYDRQEKQRVWVREYVPVAFMKRTPKGEVIANSNAQAQYKAFMADFEDLCKSLQRLPDGEKVIPVRNIIHANGTVYAIYAYIKMISLDSFLHRSGGKLSWRHTKKLLMPLFHTVANIHKAGLVHGGISPQTVMLDQSGALWMSCFSVAAVRTKKSELGGLLYDGYAAPEQYQMNSFQGAWTDVYALGAITYCALTGQTPPSAVDRVYGDDLLERSDVEATELIIAAVNKALAVEVEDRIQTAEAFIAELLANEGSNTAVYAAPVKKTMLAEGATGEILTQRDTSEQMMAQRRQAAGRASSAQVKPTPKRANYQQAPKKRRLNSVFLLVLSTLVATIVLAMGFSWISSTYLDDLLARSTNTDEMIEGVEFSSDAQGDESRMQKFIGSTIESIQKNTALTNEFELVIHEVYNSEYSSGVVFDQQPAVNEPIPENKTITLFVSKGTELVTMPAVIGLPTDTAVGMLNELQIQVQIIEVFNSSYEPNVIVKCDREAGSQIDKNKDTVVLYIRRIDMPITSSDDEGEIDKEIDLPGESSSKKSVVSKPKNSSSRNDVVSSSSSEGGRLLKPKKS